MLNWPVLVRRSLLTAALLVLAVWLLMPWMPGQARKRTVTLYGFSILGEVINQGICPDFQRRWKEKTGEEVQFISSFAGSGTVTNQVLLGVPAQIAILSLELDAMKIADRGMIPPNSWRRLPHQGVLNTTPFVILVREGNPRGIRGFGDLAQKGVGVVHPDPLTSGGAQWAILAEYGAAVHAKQDPERLLLGLWKNVVAQASSARAARTQFESGFGDALVTYEQELLSDRARGRLKGEIVYPPSTIDSEHTVVILERNIPPEDRELVQAFVDYLWTREAQQIFVDYGFQSVLPELAGQSHIAEPFSVADLGGWKKARQEIVDGLWKARVLPELGK